MYLLKILVVSTFFHVAAADDKHVEEYEVDYDYDYRYLRHGQLGNKKKDSKPGKYERWFTQHLDHFNPNDDRKWQQRYYVNDEFFDTTSWNVAFLEIGGEGEANADFMTNGAWYLYAKVFKPILFQLEHRYYGKSRPTKDLSNENLIYLNSQEALADLAIFIDAMNQQYHLSPDVKWIVFGCSYAGNLAAWMRQKYPHLVHGVVSTSGPLLAKLDFPEYKRVVQNVLRESSEECAIAIEVGVGRIDTLLLDVKGQQYITDKFKLCDKMEESVHNTLDVSNFYEVLSDCFAEAVQNNAPLTVEQLCDIMTNESLEMEIDRVAEINSRWLDRDKKTCLDFKYDKMLAQLTNTSWDQIASKRQWLYQICTEFGFFQTSTYKPQIFGDKVELDFYVKLCQNVFGLELDKTFLENVVKRTNVFYGGVDIEVNNVVFLHGSHDPWHVLGVTDVLLLGEHHCGGFYNNPANDDSQQLKDARVHIQDIIASWLNL